MKVGPPIEDSEKTDQGKQIEEGQPKKYRKHLVRLVNCATGDAALVVISEGLLKQNNPRVLRAFLQTKKIHLAPQATIYQELEQVEETDENLNNQ